ncbi:MAG: RnfABCDGE type electron transport complex subunit G [Desulfobacteraceae bacterium]|jgi:electron transport complex protein RnfG|nr:MAG: RnfABCDGE type electron transport complex subunit G [Desulfobacteraceae bacterium]
MNEMIKMVVVLTVLSALSGGLLAAVRNGTKEQIEVQQLQFVKGPAIRGILAGAANDPISDRFNIADGETEKTFFVGKFDGQPNTVVFESLGKGGYGGDVGLMVGINTDTDKILGVAVTTHSETPGLGARAKDDPKFVGQFKGLLVTQNVKVTGDGGSINAISGATITSRAVCGGISEALSYYQKMKPQIAEQIKAFR